jgi:hypothetical protein
MAGTLHPPLSPTGKFKEKHLVWILCALAAVHVVVFTAAYPLFIVDELFHFDLVVKYSGLQVPQKQDYAAEESMPYIVTFSTWEYTDARDTLSAPPWKLPPAQITPLLVSREIRWRFINKESTQPPLYYLLAGGWWRLCKAAGFHDLLLLYMLRFFNVLIVVALVWLGWLAARVVFPGSFFIRMGVPTLIAFLPQVSFYTTDNDTLSPLSFGAAFVCVLCWLRNESPSLRLGAITGLAVASVFLTKMSNLPLLGAAFIAIFFKLFLVARSKQPSRNLPAYWVLFACAILPMAAWAAWCKLYFGDFTGSAGISQAAGVTIKPFSQWWQHPIFTPHGFWFFLSGNLATLWQDEKLWHGQPYSLPPVDLIYTLLSIVFIAMAICSIKGTDASQRRGLWFALAALAASFAFFGFLSIIYDFHDNFKPSRELPYFIMGRLMLGVLLPFLLLFIFGLDSALKKFGNTGKFAALGALVLFMIVTEVATDWPIFASQYNWYHA